MKRVLPVVLLLATLSAAPQTARAGAATATYVVRTDETQFVTLRPSLAGATYHLVVDGAYAYGDHAGLADCGHFSRPDAPNGTWTANTQLRVDGVQAGCSRQPYDGTHHYEFDLAGTGRHFVFDVFDHGLGSDNAGALVVRITPAV
jgi:hypothetical protein